MIYYVLKRIFKRQFNGLQKTVCIAALRNPFIKEVDEKAFKAVNKKGLKTIFKHFVLSMIYLDDLSFQIKIFRL